MVEEQTANYQRNQAINLMTNWIATGTKINAVAANNDEMAIGALIAMQQAGIDRREGLRRRHRCDGRCADQHGAGRPRRNGVPGRQGTGSGALEAAVKLAKGEPVEQYTMIPYELVTKDNMAAYADR